MSGARRLYRTLSELLAYPRGQAGALARAALALAGAGPASGPLARFAAAAEAMAPAALEELYTTTFDLDPACAPYVGVQLLGEEDPIRGQLLARLAGIYADEGYAPREELPDHVAEVLGYLAIARPGPARDDLVADGLVPALDRMVEKLAGGSNPYRELLVATRAALGPEAASAAPARAEVKP